MSNSESKIDVVVNGEELTLDVGTTIKQLLQLRGFRHHALAVERNLEIVPQSELNQSVLQDGDSVEIVSLVGGG